MTTARSLIREYNLRPKKHLGQCFLEDLNIITKIVNFVDIKEDEVVIEIGAGLGLMTELLARRAQRVIAVEIDSQLADILRRNLKNCDNVEIVMADIRKFDFLTVATGKAREKVKVVGNIPYHITSEILFHILENRSFFAEGFLLVQKEVAERLTAPPSTKDYGIPSVTFALFGQVTKCFFVPASCFYPRPKVDSALIRLSLEEKPLFEIEKVETFFSLVRAAFAERRKTLINALKHAGFLGGNVMLLKDLLISAGIDPKRRGETLSVYEYVTLTNRLMDYLVK